MGSDPNKQMIPVSHLTDADFKKWNSNCITEKEMEQIQRDYPDLNGIMTTSAVTALGIAEATKGTGIVIASMDEQEDAVRAVEDGRILALGAQSGYQIGYETIVYILDDLEGKELEQEKILDIEILTSDNIPK